MGVPVQSVATCAPLMAAAMLPWGTGSATAEAASLRAYVESTCGAELAAFEAVSRLGETVWQLPRALEPLPPEMSPSDLRIGVWRMSGYPLTDALIVAAGSAKSPEQRGSAAQSLSAAISVTECLTPQPADWTLPGRDRSRQKEIDQDKLAMDCAVASSKNLVGLLNGPKDGEDLIREADAQFQAVMTQCKSKE